MTEDDTVETIDTLLSDLRSLVHTRRWTREERDEVWRILRTSHALDEAQHHAAIIPYLYGVKERFREPLTWVEDLGQLRNASRIAPLATFRLHPTTPHRLEDIHASNLAHYLGGLHLAPYLRDVESLEFLCEHARAFDRLSELDLSYNALSDEHIERLTRSPLLARLTRLSLHHCKLGAEAIELLCQHTSRVALRDLRISENQPGPVGFTAIFERLCTPALERLDLSASSVSSMGEHGADTFLEDAGLARLAACANLVNLRALHLQFSRIGSDGLDAIASSPYLTALEELMLDTNPLVGPEGAASIAREAHFGNLEHLSLATCRLGTQGVLALANASTLKRLRTLDLRSNKMGDEGARALASASCLSGLRALYLGVNRIEDDGARALLSSRKTAALRTFSFHGNQLGERACKAILENEVLELEELDVSRCKLGDEQGARLLGSPRLATLRKLVTRSNRLGEKSARAMKGATHFHRLEELDLNGNHLDEESCEAIFSSTSLSSLRRLHFCENTPGPRGILAMRQADFFQKLEVLTLRNTQLDHAQLRLLVEEGLSRNLRQLDLSHNHTLQDIACLLHPPTLARLERLSLTNCPLDEDQLEQLIALPGLEAGLVEDLHQQRRRMFEYY